MMSNITENKQVCRMTVTFPVESDEQAIAIKKKIGEATSELSEAQIQFSLMNLPTKAPLGE